MMGLFSLGHMFSVTPLLLSNNADDNADFLFRFDYEFYIHTVVNSICYLIYFAVNDNDANAVLLWVPPRLPTCVETSFKTVFMTSTRRLSPSNNLAPDRSELKTLQKQHQARYVILTFCTGYKPMLGVHTLQNRSKGTFLVIPHCLTLDFSRFGWEHDEPYTLSQY